MNVSLPAEDVEFLDNYAQEQGIASRSAVLHRAVRMLRAVGLSDDYQGAWQNWGDSEDDGLWSTTVSGGVRT